MDKYPNMLYADVTESAVDTLTFDSVDIGISLFDKVGLLLHRIEWYQWWYQLVADNDSVEWGLSASNQFASSDSAVAAIITYHKAYVTDFGTAGNNQIFKEPWVDDLSTLPGGGLLIVPKPLFMFVEGASETAVSVIKARIYFTIIKMKPEDYFELLETRQFFG